jgi:hypothetical protein
MEVGYCRLVTISTDNITLTNEYRSGVGAHWPFLSDAGRIVQKDLDIAEYTDRDHNPMIPHVIVLEPGLVIFKVYNGCWFFGRPTLEDLRQDLRAVTQKCRPDWDLTTPEMKAAWKEGRKELFYPYGKTYAQAWGSKIEGGPALRRRSCSECRVLCAEASAGINRYHRPIDLSPQIRLRKQPEAVAPGPDRSLSVAPNISKSAG